MHFPDLNIVAALCLFPKGIYWVVQSIVRASIHLIEGSEARSHFPAVLEMVSGCVKPRF